MDSICKRVARNKDVAFLTILTIGLLAAMRAMILTKLGD